MKKIINIFLIILLSIGVLSTNAYADDNVSLYTISEININIENYAKENVGVYMNSHYDGKVNEDYKLGQGIKIYNLNYDNKMIFPVWDNNRIIATFVVEEKDEEICAVYSEAYVNQLNYLINISSVVSPICIFSDDYGIYAVVDNTWYDLNGNAGDGETKTVLLNNDGIIINSFDKLEITPYLQPRIATSYAKSFTIFYSQGSGMYCYSFALGNILLNMGYSNCTPSNIQAYMNYKEGATKDELKNYLVSKGLTCTYSNSGYLSFDDVMNVIYNKNSYIYIGAKSNTRDANHAFVIYGYYNDGNTQLYNFWNPWYTYKQTMSATTRIINTKSTETFTWNKGYLYDIK